MDAHCHYDATTAGRVEEILDLAGLEGAVHLWDVEWPPPGFEAEGKAWAEALPRLHRCHVPDLSRLGEQGSEAALDRELRAAAAAGAVGVKLWKNLGLWLDDAAGERVSVDDPRLDAIWEAAADTGLPIAIHVGDAPAFFAPLDQRNPRLEELRAHPEWWYGSEEFPSLRQIHEEFEAVVASHPNTMFVGLHFGCFMRWADVDRMLGSYPNYHVDTATTIADMGADDAWETVRAVILGHPDRVIFGTDLIRTKPFDLPSADGGWAVGDDSARESPARWDLAEFFSRHWRFFETSETGLQHPLPIQGPWTVTGLDLPDEVLRGLYWDNAHRVFKLPRTAGLEVRS
ncbi:MAG TPA: amidohydrolase family protein [Baekduia sp.]|uniref:amidohydrolase family protein n=1 Tax=Baekduia sp. TaxID=2600305 RepID=UPI002D77789E|nr:amidohydrolase family protein [Baekduia sp.]HET6507821.1 amidohydrolase family protein [Baekduia sp.]